MINLVSYEKRLILTTYLGMAASSYNFICKVFNDLILSSVSSVSVIMGIILLLLILASPAVISFVFIFSIRLLVEITYQITSKAIDWSYSNKANTSKPPHEDLSNIVPIDGYQTENRTN